MHTKQRRKKCLSCKQWFQPDPRSHPRQHYCSKILCQKWRKAAAQRRWLAKYPDYWSGPERVKNTQEWRVEHPDWAKEKITKGRTGQALKIPVSTLP
jgi:hypothetical protein